MLTVNIIILQSDYALVLTPELAKAIILSSEPERETKIRLISPIKHPISALMHMYSHSHPGLESLSQTG